MRKLIFYMACFFFCPEVSAQSWKSYINLEQYNQAFWKSDTIVDETALPLEENGVVKVNLLFKATKILSVKTANFSQSFAQDKDWVFRDNELKIGPASSIPFLRPADLLFEKEIPGSSVPGKAAGTYVLIHEGPFFGTKQLAITYIRDKSSSWQGPVPVFAVQELPNTIARLKHQKSLKIVFYGNSIEVGYSASGLAKAPPYMPVWPELLVHALKKYDQGYIAFANRSIAGKLARWGLDSVENRVNIENPDLVIIGFGMNDGTIKVPEDVYQSQIKGIVAAVKMKNPKAEFILIAPMLANPVSSFSGIQAAYLKDLQKLAQTGVVVANMTGVHEELLKHKSYQDMTGNNVNHPNDYLARWYAQFIEGILIK